MAAASVTAGMVGYWVGDREPSAGSDPGRLISERGQGSGAEKKPASRTEQMPFRNSIYARIGEREQWRQIRDFSEDEVKAAILQIGKPRPYTREEKLQAMLFHRWAQLNPAAANEKAKDFDRAALSTQRTAALSAWVKQDGPAALTAVQNESLVWACTMSVPDEVSRMLVATLSDDDDRTAFRRVAGLPDEGGGTAALLARTRAARASLNVESRSDYLAAAKAYPNPDLQAFVLQRAEESLFDEWAKRDPDAALAAVDALDDGESDKESLRDRIRSSRRDAPKP